MPDPPFPPKPRPAHPPIAGKIGPSDRVTTRPTLSRPRYAALRCRTNFTFLDGASHPDELVGTAVGHGYTALAITERNSLAGVVRAHVAAKEARAAGVDFGLIVGAELTPEDGPPLVVWVTDRASYGRLCRLLTRGRRRAPKGECRFTVGEIAEHADGLVAGVPLSALGDDADVGIYREAFGDRLYGLVDSHRGPQERLRLDRLVATSRRLGLSPVAADHVLYHEPERRHLHAALTAVRLGCPVAALAADLPPNGEHALRPLDDAERVYARYPDLLTRTAEVADRCRFTLDELRYEYPEELVPDGRTPARHLRDRTEAGITRRYPHGAPIKVRDQVEHELGLIGRLRYEAYFLTVADLVEFARSRDILCQGRGSAANSAVCYCLGVTEVNPAESDLLFERFISAERDEAPDIDVDFEHERREEVLQYLYERYGRERAGMAATVITYRHKSAVRDLGKALGLSADRLDLISRHLGRFTPDDDLASRFAEAGLDPTSRLGRQLHHLTKQLLGFPRHLSQHVGGMVMTRGRLDELCVIENASMPGRTVVQWDKDDLEALGILKVDCLGLGMLTAIRRCVALINESRSVPLTLGTIPHDDPAVYAMIRKADTIGVFQIESRAQMAMLPRLKPKEFYDLVIEVAIVRPGPIQGDMVHPYLKRRDGLEPVTYPSDEVEDVLRRTLGVPLFQEQAMKLASVAAGFTPGESDQFRRAIGAWRSTGKIDEFEKRLKDGLAAKGYADEFAERLFKQIRGFGEYGFPESHAASFAILVYFSCWLKCYHPAEFCAALLNSQPMGFYAPAQLVRDARKHGVEVRPACVNASVWDSTLEPAFRPAPVEIGRQTHGGEHAVRLGFGRIKGLGREAADRLVVARGDRPFGSFDDLARRTGLDSRSLDRLADADAFRSLDLDRREARWQALPDHRPVPLLSRTPQTDQPVRLPPLTHDAEVRDDYRTTGLSLKGHPVEAVRDRLAAMNVVTTAELRATPAGRRVRVAGIVLLRQRPGTAKGVTFITIEDETDNANLIVWRDVWERQRIVARTASAVIVTGRVQKDDTGLVVHVVVEHLDDLSSSIGRTLPRSRDFQ
ncbi:MAG: error-prone DNA polymerase [Planctomycetota bacterium]